MKIFMVLNRKTTRKRTLTLFFAVLFAYGVCHASENSLVPMPASEYAEFLDVAASLTEANYAKIKTWQGEMNIEEDNYLYGEQCRSLNIDANEPAVNSNIIRRVVSASVTFSTDVQNDRLYTKMTPNVKYRSVDLNRDIDVKEKYSPVISVVTPSEYLSYQPNHTYGYKRETVKNGKWVGKNAFRLPVEKVKGEQWGHVRDPRKYFYSDNKTIWELLYTLRDLIVTPPKDIPEGKSPRIDISTEETETRTLAHIKCRFYPSPTCTNDEDSFINASMTLDSSVNMNLVHREVADKAGNVLQTMDITYEKISDVYVPKTVNFKMFRSSDQAPKFDSQITFTKSRLNLPVSENTFNYRNLGLNDGDRFTDEIENKHYYHKSGGELVEISKED